MSSASLVIHYTPEMLIYSSGGRAPALLWGDSVTCPYQIDGIKQVLVAPRSP